PEALVGDHRRRTDVPIIHRFETSLSGRACQWDGPQSRAWITVQTLIQGPRWMAPARDFTHRVSPVPRPNSASLQVTEPDVRKVGPERRLRPQVGRYRCSVVTHERMAGFGIAAEQAERLGWGRTADLTCSGGRKFPNDLSTHHI